MKHISNIFCMLKTAKIMVGLAVLSLMMFGTDAFGKGCRQGYKYSAYVQDARVVLENCDNGSVDVMQVCEEEWFNDADPSNFSFSLVEPWNSGGKFSLYDPKQTRYDKANNGKGGSTSSAIFDYGAVGDLCYVWRISSSANISNLKIVSVGAQPKVQINGGDEVEVERCSVADCELKFKDWECDHSTVPSSHIILLMFDRKRERYINSPKMGQGWKMSGVNAGRVCYTLVKGDSGVDADDSLDIVEGDILPETVAPASTTAPVDAEQEQETTTPANTTTQQAETQSSTTTDTSTTPAASSGDCNTPKEREDRGAVEIQKQGALCVATKCKSDHYKVKDASGAYQGWCIHKECPAGQHVDTDKDGMVLRNDIKCVADTTTDAEAQVEAPDATDAEKSAAATETVETTSDPALEKETPVQTGPADGEECTKPGARQAEYRNGKCIAMECDDGYEPSGDNCVKISGPCESLPAHAVRGHRKYNADTGDTECIIEDCDDGYVVADDKLSCHEDYDALAKQAREREQSTGNKLVGALGMGATGIGGSMLMSGLAESASDDEAERAMAAYLETFTCKYGNESVSGGTMNVEIPGGNELINMYSEYVALANDLKLRKAALGMKPGIESEPILDSATSGLYDDVGTGRGKGAYASLARALENPDGEDAKAWAAQREESEKKKKTGAIVAGIGAVGSLIGNAAINADWGKNKHKALRDLEEDVNNIRPSSTPCPDGTIGLEHPDCVCVNRAREYNRDTGKCEVPETKSTTVTDTLDRLWEPDETVTAVLSASSLFEINSSKLLPQAKRALNEFIDKLKVKQGCVLTISGYTDPTGDYDKNYDLSMKRAQSVADYISDKNSNVDVLSEGFGEHSCTCGTRKYLKAGQIDYSKEDYKICRDKEDSHKLSGGDIFAPCRRVEIQMQNCELESDVAAALEQGAGNIAGGALGSLTTAVTGQ